MKSKSFFFHPKAPFIIISIAFVLVAVSLFFGKQAFKATEKATFEEFNKRQLVLAKEVSEGVELYFKILSENMKALGRVIGANQLDETITEQEIQQTFEVLKQFGVNDVGVLDSSGILRNNIIAHQIIGVDFSWRKYFQEAKKMNVNDNYIIEFIEFKGADIGQKGVLVAVPILQNTGHTSPPSESQQFGGVVVCTLKLNTLIQKFISDVKSSAKGHVFLIDDEQTILFSVDPALFGKNYLKISNGFDELQQILQKMSAGYFGTANYSFYDFNNSIGKYTEHPEEKLIAYAPIHVGNDLWSIGVWAPQYDARKLIYSVYRNHQLLVGLIVTIILIGAFWSLFLFSRISNSLKKEVDLKTGELRESELKHRTLLENIPQKIFYKDTNSIYISCNELYASDLNIKPDEIFGKTDYDFHPDDLAEKYRADDKKIIESGEIEEFEEEYLHEGKKTFIHTVKSPVKDEHNKVIGILGVFRDITERKQIDNHIKTSLKEKELLLREIHHRVKNNMQVISSLLNLQARYIKDEHYASLFYESRNRIKLMALIHEKLYNSHDITNINSNDYIKSLANGLLAFYGTKQNTISLRMNIEEISLGIDAAIPCGLLINELLSNSLKHAFPDNRKGEINISFRKPPNNKDSEYELIVSDDGVGIPIDLDIRKSNSIGLELVTSLAEHQLQGKLQLIRKNGTKFIFRFKELIYNKRL